MQIERCNLLGVARLVVKELIDSSLKQARCIDDSHLSLQQFFTVIEHLLRHGIKRTEHLKLNEYHNQFYYVYCFIVLARGLLRNKRDFWQVLEQVERFHPEASDMTKSVRQIPNIKCKNIYKYLAFCSFLRPKIGHVINDARTLAFLLTVTIYEGQQRSFLNLKYDLNCLPDIIIQTKTVNREPTCYFE